MAKFNAEGIEGLAPDLETFLSLPDEAVESILEAEGQVVAAAHRDSIRSHFKTHTGKLLDSVAVLHKAGGSGNKRYVVVYPQGAHHTYKRRVVVKTYARSKHGSTYAVGGDVKTAASGEVGYVLEYGALKRGLAPRKWMAEANDRSADAAAEAGQRVLDDYLTKHNL